MCKNQTKLKVDVQVRFHANPNYFDLRFFFFFFSLGPGLVLGFMG
jgi:hypothetical protein